jgi:hypothetical protein
VWRTVGAFFFFVDTNFLLAARSAVKVFFTDGDLFLFVLGTFLAVGKSGGEGRVACLVTFPSDARSSRRKVGFSFYSDLSSVFDSVAPVRRREDTEGNRDSGVKVQIDGLEGVFSRMPFEPLW